MNRFTGADIWSRYSSGNSGERITRSGQRLIARKN